MDYAPYLQGLSRGVEVALGLAFLMSVVPKALHPLAFVDSVQNYRLLPTYLVTSVAIAILLLEWFVALTFTTGWQAMVGSWVALFLLVVFVIAVSTTIKRRLEIPCGCFGGTSEMVSGRSLKLIAVLLLGVLLSLATRGVLGMHSSANAGAAINIADDPFAILPLALFLNLLCAWLFKLNDVVAVVRSGH